jgi:hypothetical protein
MNTGENLFNAARLIVKAGKEIEALVETIYKMLETELPNLDPVRKIEWGDDKWDESDNWIYDGFIQNIGIFKKSKKLATATLAVQVLLCDIEEEEIVGPCPLLYVLYCAGGSWDYKEFTISHALDEECRYDIENSSLWSLYDDEDTKGVINWEESQFVYVVPLTSINKPADISELIINPIKMAIQGKNIAEYLSSKEKIMKFAIKNDQVILK